MPGWLRRVVLRGLSLDASRRFASLEALLEALHDDPRTRYGRQVLVAVAAAFLVAVVAGALSQWHQRQSACQDVATRLDGVWDAPRREALQRAFFSTGQPYAADAWQGVRGTLEAYATGWRARQGAACELTRVQGRATEEVLTLRTACLERRRSELKALTDVLLRNTAASVERSVEAVRGLSELSVCDTAAPLALHAQLPTALAPQVDEARAGLSRARVLRLLGQSSAGLAVALPVENTARTLGYRPLEAEALLELGQQRAALSDPAAESTLRQAVWTADEAGLDEVRAEALVALTQLVAYDTTRMADGHEWYHQARALLTRTARAGRLLAELESAHGLLFSAQGDALAAEASQRRALAALEGVVPSDGPEAAVVLRRLGSALSAQGRHTEALAVFERAHAAFQKALGAEHPRVGSTLVNLGTTLSALGRPGEALPPCATAWPSWSAPCPGATPSAPWPWMPWARRSPGTASATRPCACCTGRWRARSTPAARSTRTWPSRAPPWARCCSRPDVHRRPSRPSPARCGCARGRSARATRSWPRR